MDKAILIMDMPNSCMGCNFFYFDGDISEDSCKAREKARPVDFKKYDKPDWCPLRPVPGNDETETRNKAIDDFVCYMCNEFDSEYAAVEEHTGEYVIKRVHSIAEHLKGG